MQAIVMRAPGRIDLAEVPDPVCGTSCPGSSSRWSRAGAGTSSTTSWRRSTTWSPGHDTARGTASEKSGTATTSPRFPARAVYGGRSDHSRHRLAPTRDADAASSTSARTTTHAHDAEMRMSS